MASTTRAGTKNSPICTMPPTIPATRTSRQASAASPFTGSGAKAAAAANGAGAIASSNDHHVTASGSTLTSAEMVISCAAPASSSAARSHRRLGGAGRTGRAPAGTAVLAAVEVSAGAFGVIIFASLMGHVRRL
jgi:hypothetical protein